MRFITLIYVTLQLTSTIGSRIGRGNEIEAVTVVAKQQRPPPTRTVTQTRTVTRTMTTTTTKTATSISISTTTATSILMMDQTINFTTTATSTSTLTEFPSTCSGSMSIVEEPILSSEIAEVVSPSPVCLTPTVEMMCTEKQEEMKRWKEDLVIVGQCASNIHRSYISELPAPVFEKASGIGRWLSKFYRDCPKSYEKDRLGVLAVLWDIYVPDSISNHRLELIRETRTSKDVELEASFSF